MREIMLKEAVELKVPATQNMMMVLRLTTAGVVARVGLTVDRMDDVKMAVEEACSCLMDGQHPPKIIALRFEDRGDHLMIRVCGDCDCDGILMNEDEAGVVRCILESLVDGVNVLMHGGGIGALELRVALEQ